MTDTLPLQPVDRYTAWPIILPLVISLAVATTISFSWTFGLLLLALGILAVSAWTITTIVLIVVAFHRRHWRRTASLLTVLVLVWPIMLAETFAGDYVHLAILYPVYRVEIGSAERSSFDWGGTGLVGSVSGQRSLIYDTTGGTETEIGTRPLPAEPRVSITTQHLIGNFYLRTATW